MPSEIAGWFTDRGLSPPEGVPAMARAAYESLATGKAVTVGG